MNGESITQKLLFTAMSCLRAFILYVIPCLAALILIYRLLKPKPYIFRKILHFVAFSCTSLVIVIAEDWRDVVICFGIVALMAYPILSRCERHDWFARFFVEKGPGEVTLSMVLLFSMIAAVTAVGWGIFGQQALSAAAVFMWGVGDGAAALVGIPWGKHKLNIGFEKGKKSLEGTLADFVVAAAGGMIFLCGYAHMEPGPLLLPVILAAAAGAFTELISPSRYDTVNVPAAVLAVLLLFIR